MGDIIALNEFIKGNFQKEKLRCSVEEYMRYNRKLPCESIKSLCKHAFIIRILCNLKQQNLYFNIDYELCGLLYSGTIRGHQLRKKNFCPQHLDYYSK